MRAQTDQSMPHVIGSIPAYTASIASDSDLLMVPVQNYVRPVSLQWYYATTHNFTHRVLYHQPVAYLRKKAALQLAAVNRELNAHGLGLKLFDAYRPYSVTKKMWKVVPDDRYAANPAKGSGHNRGIAVDLTIIDLRTGSELPMPTPFDDFTEKAHHDYQQLPAEVIRNRSLLRQTMEKFGFVALETEWWHYSLPDPKQYPLLDLSFRQMKHLVK